MVDHGDSGADALLEQLNSEAQLATRNAEHWHSVCRTITDLFGAVGTIFLPFDPEFRGPWMIESPALCNLTKAYLQGEWHRRDARQILAKTLVERGYATDDDAYSAEQRLAIPYYSELMIPHGAGFFIGIHVETPSGDWRISIQFAHGRPPIDEQEIDWCRRVKSILERSAAHADDNALAKIREFSNMLTEAATDVLVLDSIGNICVYEQGLALFANESQNVEHLIPALPNGLTERLLKLCSSDPKQVETGEALTFRFENTQYNMLAIHAPRSIRHFHYPYKILLIISTVPDSRKGIQEAFQRRFGVTRSEFMTLEILSQGRSIGEISELMGLRESTIRQRLKIIFQKTGTSSQAQLLAAYMKIQAEYV